MNYKNYTFKMSGVFTLKNNKKYYSLEIYQGENQIFKTDYIYENEKKAFKVAKKMVNQNRFDSEIIRENVNKEILKNNVVYQNSKINKFANIVIIISTILTIITCIITALGINEVNKGTKSLGLIFGILFVGFGILMSLMILYWGIFAKGGYELNNKQRKIYSIMWWINLFVNNGPVLSYNDQPFKDKQKGWYSSSGLVTLLLESFFGIFLIGACIVTNNFGLTFYGVISTCILILISYIFSIVWEISDSKINGEVFPFKRIFSPILAILTMATFVYFYIKIVGIYK